MGFALTVIVGTLVCGASGNALQSAKGLVAAPTDPATDPVHPATDSVHPATAPPDPATDPAHPATDPAHPATDPAHPATDPAAPAEPTAAPGSGNPTLTAARQAYSALDYQKARNLLKRALAEENLSDSDRTEALAYLARVFAVLGQPDRATRRFEQLLALHPDFEISWEESPRIREAFAAAVENLRATQQERSRGEQPSHVQPPHGAEASDTAPWSTTHWLIGGGVAAVLAGVIIAILVVDSGGELSDPPDYRWQLP